jgi:hypothetical protein
VVPQNFYTSGDVKAVRLPALAAATAASATTTAATATAATTATTTTATGRLRARFVNVQRATIHFGSVKLGNCRFGVPLFRHFHEGKAPWLTAVAIGYDVNSLNAAVLCKRVLQIFLRGLVAQISDKDVRHTASSFFQC